MYTTKLTEKILLKPAEEGCDSLKIITGYTDVGFIGSHLVQLADLIKERKRRKISVEMILGMTGPKAITKKKHDNIQRTIQNWKKRKGVKFICRYKTKGKDIHSKVYLWLQGKDPKVAFCGSANYSENAFSKRRECMTECNPQEALLYFNELISDTLEATDQNIAKEIRFANKGALDLEDDAQNLENLSYNDYQGRKPVDTCSVSLLVATGERTGNKSGLNWGQRGTRDKNQAYIPYNKPDRKNGFFPLKESAEKKNNPLFKVVVKDFPPFLMRVAQDNGKGLQSAESNAILGSFFRQKLGLGDGVRIEKKDLEKYGTTRVLFKKYDDGVFLMDFEPESRSRS